MSSHVRWWQHCRQPNAFAAGFARRWKTTSVADLISVRGATWEMWSHDLWLTWHRMVQIWLWYLHSVTSPFFQESSPCIFLARSCRRTAVVDLTCFRRRAVVVASSSSRRRLVVVDVLSLRRHVADVVLLCRRRTTGVIVISIRRGFCLPTSACL